MSKKPSDKVIAVFDKIKENKKIQYVLIGILAIIAIVILIFGNYSTNKSTSQTDIVTQYVQTLENKLSSTLSCVEGAGKVNVVITVESGMETVLANKITTTETANGKETVETPIIINGKPVTVKENYPKIVGVLIVSEGANSISVMRKLQQATVSLLNINVDQIEILAMK